MLSVISMLFLSCALSEVVPGYELLRFSRKTVTGGQNKKAPRHVEQPKTQKH